MMPRPDEWQHHLEMPKDDNEYFERMSRVIFTSGLKWTTLEKKWPGLRRAFDNFDIAVVADYSEAKVDQLMGNSDVIRNLGKIKAVIGNAAKMQQLIRENGSFKRYLDDLEVSGGEELLTASLSKQFAYLGKGTTVIFLLSVGIQLPKATSEWHEQHQ